MPITEDPELKASTPQLPLTFAVTVADGDAARRFYADALGAREVIAVVDDDEHGRLSHAHLVADDVAANVQLFLGEDYRSEGMNAAAARPGSRSPASAYVVVPECDVAFQRFVKAGAIVTERPRDMFYGMRVGKVVDPFGVGWSFGSRIKKLPSLGSDAPDGGLQADPRLNMDM